MGCIMDSNVLGGVVALILRPLGPVSGIEERWVMVLCGWFCGFLFKGIE